jgi:hypothetical protein
MPAGMLLANEPDMSTAVKSSTSNWYDVEQASNLFERMNTLALKTRREVARLQAQGYELNWREHSRRLARAKNHINDIGDDMQQLNHMKNRLEPWQQSLIDQITPNLRGMVYQTDAALNTLTNYESRRLARSASKYPGYISGIYRNANQMANTIQSVTQSAHGEEMSALNMSGANAGS